MSGQSFVQLICTKFKRINQNGYDDISKNYALKVF